MRADLSRRTFRGAVGLLTVLFLVVCSVWAFASPPLRPADEPHHVNSIFRLASGGGWPEPGQARVGTSVLQAAHEAGLLTLGETFDAPDRSMLRSADPFYPTFDETPVTPHSERSAIGSVPAADPESQVRDQMTQHPPLYYLGGAAVVHLFGLDSVPWDRALLTLRLYSVALMAPLVPALAGTARVLGASRLWSLVAALPAIGLPQIAAVGGVVSNDAPAVSLSALAIWALAWAGMRPISARTVLIAGGAVGLALWIKGNLLALGLPLILVFLWRPGQWQGGRQRSWQWRRPVVAALAAGVVSQIVCPWWLRNLIVHGAIQPDGFRRPRIGGWEGDTIPFPEFVADVLNRLVTSFVGKFGWGELALPAWLSWTVVLVLIAAAVVGIARMPARRSVPVSLNLAAIGMIVILVRESWAVYAQTGETAGVQGRYLLPFLGALTVGVLAWAQLGRWAARLLALAAVALNAAGLALFITVAYPGAPVDVGRFALVLGAAPWVLALTALVYLAALIAVVVLVWTLARRSLGPPAIPPAIAR